MLPRPAVPIPATAAGYREHRGSFDFFYSPWRQHHDRQLRPASQRVFKGVHGNALAPRCSDTRTSCRHQTIAAASRLLKEFEDDHAEACVFSEFLGTFPPGPLISPRSLTSLPPSVRVVQ